MSFSSYLAREGASSGIILTPAQKSVVQVFEEVDLHLRSSYEKSNSFRERFFPPSPFKNPPRGIYLWGDVGRGKTMIMDQYQSYATFLKSERFHFYDFMSRVQQELEKFRQKKIPFFQEKHPRGSQYTFLHQVALLMTASWEAVFLDEFFVDNIADAMILGPLFQEILALRKFIFLTSNASPDQLYEKGLNREAFLPFIQLLKDQLKVVVCEGEEDQRSRLFQTLPLSSFFVFPVSLETDGYLIHFFNTLSGREPLQTLPEVLQEGKESVLLNFKGYFSKPTGPREYQGLASRFKIIFLARLPQLGDDRKDEVRRFISFVDILYNRKCRLIISAECDIPDVYAGTLLKGEMKRILSRLKEMQIWKI